MDYIKYYRELQQMDVISKDRCFKLIKKHKSRYSYQKIPFRNIVTFILCLKRILIHYNIDSNILEGIVSMAVLPCINNVDIGIRIYSDKRKAKAYNFLNELKELNTLCNNLVNETLFIEKCNFREQHKFLKQKCVHYLNHNNMIINYYKQLIKLEEEKMENVNNLLVYLHNTNYATQDKLLAHRLALLEFYNFSINSSNNKMNHNIISELEPINKISNYLDAYNKREIIIRNLNKNRNKMINIINKIEFQFISVHDIKLYSKPNIEEFENLLKKIEIK